MPKRAGRPPQCVGGYSPSVRPFGGQCNPGQWSPPVSGLPGYAFIHQPELGQIHTNVQDIPASVVLLQLVPRGSARTSRVVCKEDRSEVNGHLPRALCRPQMSRAPCGGGRVRIGTAVGTLVNDTNAQMCMLLHRQASMA